MIGQLFGLHHQMDHIRPLEFARVQLVGLEQIEHFEHRESLGRGRGLIEHQIAVLALEWLTPAGGLRSKIGLAKQPALFG